MIDSEYLKYPIRFIPILQEKIWGGSRLVSKYNKKSNSHNVGESWEISGVEGNISKVANGFLKGSTLTQLLKTYKGELIGKKNYQKYGNKFPLLFKLIDATDNLSIQLHPNDELAKERHNSFGKTEMWYVLEADKESKIYAGFDRKMDKEKYLQSFDRGDILDIIHKDSVKKGNAFLIEAGTIHAIGKGILIVEVQQTSDVTYRIYDWDRVNLKGKGRELHTNLAIEALDFKKVGTCKLTYEEKSNASRKVVDCKYFTVNKLSFTKSNSKDVSNIDSFMAYICVDGKGTVLIENKEEKIEKGDTFLISANVEEIVITPTNHLEFLEVYIDNKNE